jgi:hypothetical protein
MLDINLFREDKGGNPVRELAIRVVARAASLVLRNGGSSGTRPSIDRSRRDRDRDRDRGQRLRAPTRVPAVNRH